MQYANVWYRITDYLYLKFPFNQTVAIWLYSNLGKYLPLKIAKHGYRLGYYTQKKSYSAENVVKGCYIETIASVLGGFIVFFIFSLSYNSQNKLISFTSAALVLIVLAALLLLTLSSNINKYIYKTFNVSLFADNISMRRMLFIIMEYCIAWIISGLAFYCVIKSVVPSFPYASIPQAIFIFSLGGVIGIVAIFAPSGIGVREGIIVFCLSTYLSVAEATIIALLSRVVIIVAEFSGIIYGFVYTQNMIKND